MSSGFKAFPEDGLLGVVEGQAPGPTVIIVAAQHGNEPAGAWAAQQMLDQLARRGLPRGRVAARIGNRAALARGVRHQGHDQNRMWGQPPPPPGPDADEYHALAAWLAPLMATPAVILDLHTTSAGGPPFALATATPANHHLGTALPFPLVFGLLEDVPGTLAQWAATQGHASLAVEAGRHDDPQAVAIHTHVLWVLLHHLGCTDDPVSPLAGLPGPAIMRVVHTHHIKAGDDFVMRPGFTSFQPVEVGTLLAHDRHGEVRAPHSGRLLMPLYQASGREGFFIAQDGWGGGGV
jgi:predicted deacylase